MACILTLLLPVPLRCCCVMCLVPVLYVGLVPAIAQFAPPFVPRLLAGSCRLCQPTVSLGIQVCL